jgi:2-polyprenyl-3-methyl-5-hydroxy-6-metoxy-1,4-benzoquinol methylase
MFVLDWLSHYKYFCIKFKQEKMRKLVLKYKSLSWTEDQIKNFWEYESQFPERYFSYQVADKLISRLRRHIKNAKFIVDYGCGNGDLISELLNQTDAEISGVEFSTFAIDKVNKKFSINSNFRQVIKAGAKFDENNSVDLVITCEVIEHLSDDMLVSFINDIKKLLRVGGKLIITTPNRENLHDNMLFCPNCQHTYHRWQHMRSWSKESLSVFLEEAGFEIEHIFEKDLCIAVNPFQTPYFLLRRIFLKIFLKQKSPHLVAVALLKSQCAAVSQLE